jgi:hypothetical protein
MASRSTAATPPTPVRCCVCEASEAAGPLLRCAYHPSKTQATCATPVCTVHAARRSPTVGYCPQHAWMGALPVFAVCPRCGGLVGIRRWQPSVGATPGAWVALEAPRDPVTGIPHAPTCIGCERRCPLLDENAQA